MSAPEPSLRLAGLSLWVFGYAYPDCNDYWDGNWLNVRVRAETSGSRVEASGALLRIDELTSFTRELDVLYRNLTGTAELKCLESALGVKVACDLVGHIQVIVDLTPDHMTESHEFKFELDQTYLPATLAGCKTVLDRFPIKDPDQRILPGRQS